MQVTKEKYQEYLQVNEQRRAVLFAPYDPVSGSGSPLERVKFSYMVSNKQVVVYLLPEMINNEKVVQLLWEEGSVESVLKALGIKQSRDAIDDFLRGFINIRLDYDFEFWAAVAANIKEKATEEAEGVDYIPFTLNYPQRKLLKALEKMRMDGVPIRAIIDKARQWGGSTLVQMYMAWIQIRKKTNWNSAIVAHVESQGTNIRQMFMEMAKRYPDVFGDIAFNNYGGSSKIKQIKNRGNLIGVGSVQKPDYLRSFDFTMAHLSECGLWRATEGKTPEEMAQAIRAGIPYVPYTVIVLESTAKGVGNFFHREWLRAIGGKSGYAPVFIAWYEIEMYMRKPRSYRKLINFIDKDEYAKYLWELGATLEGIEWYFNHKEKENFDDWTMHSEFPSTWQESFSSTGQRVFPPHYVQYARSTCHDPEAIGDVTADAQYGKDALNNVNFYADPKGLLKIWDFPDDSITVKNRYEVTVDIGGTTPQADHSVIKVFDRYWMMFGEAPVVVAVWEGHIDQDLVAWRAAQIGNMYHNALVTVEVNSLSKEENTEGVHYLTVLDEIVESYPNLYMRTDPQKVRDGYPAQYGFHTNTASKSLAINALKAALRERMYIEKDLRACDEMDTYEVKPNGSLGAVTGCRDDHVMVNAIGVWVCTSYMPMPVVVSKSSGKKQKKVSGESTF